MGMWAYAPWDNDAAADWYGDLMDRTNIRECWLEGIDQDPDDAPDVVRAASALFIMLGRVYVWPIKTFEQDLEKTIAALSSVAECAEYQEVPELVESIAQEIAELKSRREPHGVKSTQSSRSEPKPWWKFWK